MQCKYCGKDMKIGFKKRTSFCSDECRRKFYSPRKIFDCIVCGKKLVGHQRLFCSSECRLKDKSKAQQAKNKEIYKAVKLKSKVRHKPKMSIAEINERARQEGLNYGQYVAKYGL